MGLESAGCVRAVGGVCVGVCVGVGGFVGVGVGGCVGAGVGVGVACPQLDRVPAMA